MGTAEAVLAKLSAAPTLLDLVGTKVYPGKAQEGAQAPFIVFLVVSEVVDSTFTGAVGAERRESRVQLDCYAKTYQAAHRIADAVEAALGDSVGEFDAWVDGSQDLYDDAAQLHRVTLEFWVSR